MARLSIIGDVELFHKTETTEKTLRLSRQDKIFI